jgi:hypothetical protein
MCGQKTEACVNASVNLLGCAYMSIVPEIKFNTFMSLPTSSCGCFGVWRLKNIHINIYLHIQH